MYIIILYYTFYNIVKYYNFRKEILKDEKDKLGRTNELLIN